METATRRVSLSRAAPVSSALVPSATPSFRSFALPATINAAAALIVAGKAKDLKDGVALGTKSLDSGAALQKLHRLADVSNA